VLDADTLVVVYVSTDPHTRRYDLDIIAEIRAQLGQDAVTVLSAQPIPAELGPAIVLPGLDGLGDALVALPYLVFAQYVALFTSLEYAKTPDNPFPSGEVSRVVKGVTIYPMPTEG
ncbi:MAG: D-galactosamine 6-phosphate deaminase/isomerase, partial [Mycobacterium sp.]|nr:D-galactosamine 6-phosphate deaminase/isomerase [Mycobacterium sp.]